MHTVIEEIEHALFCSIGIEEGDFECFLLLRMIRFDRLELLGEVGLRDVVEIVFRIEDCREMFQNDIVENFVVAKLYESRTK